MTGYEGDRAPSQLREAKVFLDDFAVDRNKHAAAQVQQTLKSSFGAPLRRSVQAHSFHVFDAAAEPTLHSCTTTARRTWC